MTTYGPTHRWFAWRPVNTKDRGWRWLRFVWRYRVAYDSGGYSGRFFMHVVDRSEA